MSKENNSCSQIGDAKSVGNFPVDHFIESGIYFVENKEEKHRLGAPLDIISSVALPENRESILNYGNGIIYILRHGKATAHGPTDAKLHEEGAEQVIQTGSVILREIEKIAHTMPHPIDISIFYTDRNRAESSAEVLFIDLMQRMKEKSESDSLLHNTRVVHAAAHPLLSTADHMKPLFESGIVKESHLTLNHWLAAEKELIHGQQAVIVNPYTNKPEKMARGVHHTETLEDVKMFLSERNERALQDPSRIHLDIAVSHEPTFASLINRYFPDLDPNPKYAEPLAVNLGNEQRLSHLVYRGAFAAVELPLFDPEYTERVRQLRYSPLQDNQIS